MSSAILINASLNCEPVAATQSLRNLTLQTMAFLAFSPGGIADMGAMAQTFGLVAPWRSIDL